MQITPPTYKDKINVANVPLKPSQVHIINKNLLSPNPKASLFIIKEIIKFKSSKQIRKKIERKKYL